MMSDFPYFCQTDFLPSSHSHEFTLSIQDGLSFDENFSRSSVSESNGTGAAAPPSRSSQNSLSTRHSVSIHHAGAVPAADTTATNHTVDKEPFTSSSVLESNMSKLLPCDGDETDASTSEAFFDASIGADKTPSSLSCLNYLSFSPLLSSSNYSVDPQFNCANSNSQTRFGSPSVPPPPPTAIPFSPVVGSGTSLNLLSPSNASFQNGCTAGSNAHQDPASSGGAINHDCKGPISMALPTFDNLCWQMPDESSLISSLLTSPINSNSTCPAALLPDGGVSMDPATPMVSIPRLLSAEHDLSALLHTSKRWQNLNIVLPVTVPSGTIVVTKRQIGENTFVFPDSMRGAQMLFSSAGRVCDSWATNLRLRVAVIHKCPDFLVPKVVEVFNRHLNNLPKFAEPIKLRCAGLVKHTIRLRSSNGLTYRYDTIGHLQSVEDQRKMQLLFDHLQNVLYEVNHRLVNEALSVFSCIHKVSTEASSGPNASQLLLPGSEIYDTATGKCGLEFRFSPCKEFKIAIREGTPCDCLGVDNYVTGGSSTSNWAQQFSVDEVVINEIRMERDKTMETQIDPAFAPEYSLKTRAMSLDVDGTPARVYFVNPLTKEMFRPRVDPTVYYSPIEAGRAIYNANYLSLAALLPGGMHSLVGPVPAAAEPVPNQPQHRLHLNLPAFVPQPSQRRQPLTPMSTQQGHFTGSPPPQSYNSAVHERPRSVSAVGGGGGAMSSMNQDRNVSAPSRTSFQSGPLNNNTAFSSPRQLSSSPSYGSFKNLSNCRPQSAVPYMNHHSTVVGDSAAVAVRDCSKGGLEAAAAASVSNPCRELRGPLSGSNADGIDWSLVQANSNPSIDGGSAISPNCSTSQSNGRSKDGGEAEDLESQALHHFAALKEIFTLISAKDGSNNNVWPTSWNCDRLPRDEQPPQEAMTDTWNLKAQEASWPTEVGNSVDQLSTKDSSSEPHDDEFGVLSALVKLQTALCPNNYDASSPIFSSLTALPLNGVKQATGACSAERTTSAGATTKGDDFFEMGRQRETKGFFKHGTEERSNPPRTS